MKHLRVAFLLTVTAAAAAGCSAGGPSPAPTSAPVTLSASPSAHTFALNETSPLTVWVDRSAGTLTGFTATVSNPQEFGVLSVGISGPVAQVLILPVASGAMATATFADASGAMTTASLSPAICGRPENNDYRSQLIWPLPDATGVSPNVGTLYFAVFTPTSLILTTKLHMVVGTTSTLEGGTLQTATPPIGAATPTPPPGMLETYMSASVPTLPSGANIHTQIYDDTCQGALLTGTFST